MSDMSYEKQDELNENIISIKNMCDGRTLASLENRKFTSDIADAWVLVEEMVKDERVATVNVWCDYGTWFCEVDEVYGKWYASTKRHFEHSDPSVPLAIAKCYYEWRTHDRTS